MRVQGQRDRGRVWPWALAWGAATACLIALFIDYQIEDAFITFRYGENLARGEGLVFNPGERIMGSTAPGQALLSALTWLVAGHVRMPDVMTALGIVAWTAQAPVLFFLARPELGAWPARVLALVTLLGLPGQPAFGSMETNHTILFGLLGLLAGTRGRLTLAAVAFAAAVTFRPDAVLFAAAALWPAWRRYGRGLARPLVLFASLAAAWPLFAWWYFGSALPNSFHTKQGAVQLGKYALHLWRAVPERLVPVEDLWGAAPFLVWPLVAVGGAALVLARGWLAAFPLHAALHLTAYLVLRPFVAHDWHLVPGELSATVCLIAGAAALVAPLAPRLRLPIGATLAGALAITTAQRLALTSLDTRSSYWVAGRLAVYREVTAFMRDHARPDDTLASLEVGYLGYFTGLRMHDLGALINRPHRYVYENGRATFDQRQFDWLMIDRSSSKALLPAQAPVAVFEHDGFGALVFRSSRGPAAPVPRPTP